MNIRYFFICILFLLTNHHICLGQLTFNKVIKDSLHDLRVSDAVELSDGSFILTSLVEPYVPQNTKSELVKLDGNGGVIKRKVLSFGSKPSGLMSICVLDEHQFFLSGFVREDSLIKLWLCTVDNDLNKLNEKLVSLNGYNLVMTKVKSTYDGKLICYGSVEDTTSYQQPSAFIYLMTHQYDSINLKIYSDHWSFGLDILQRNDDQGFYMVGLGFADGPPGKIVSLNNNLQILKIEGMPDVDNMSSISYCDDKHIIATGERTYAWPSTEVRDIGVLKYDTLLNLIRSKAYGAKDTEDCPGWMKNIAAISLNSIFISGTKNLSFSALYANQPSWFMLNKTDTSLSLKWQKFFGGDGYYTLMGIIPTKDSGCLMYGTFWDYQHITEYVNYISVIKVNKDGLLLGIDGEPSSLMQDVIIYPNPGNDHIWAMTQLSETSIEFCNITGKTVLKRPLLPGRTQIETSELPQGIYIYRIYSKTKQIQTGKWIKN